MMAIRRTLKQKAWFLFFDKVTEQRNTIALK
jgi:hypothetical protein